MSVPNKPNDHIQIKKTVKNLQGIIVLDDSDILEGIRVRGNIRDWKPSAEDISTCFAKHPMLKCVSDNSRVDHYVFCRHFVSTVTNMRSDPVCFKSYFQRTKVLPWNTDDEKKFKFALLYGLLVYEIEENISLDVVKKIQRLNAIGGRLFQFYAHNNTPTFAQELHTLLNFPKYKKKQFDTLRKISSNNSTKVLQGLLTLLKHIITKKSNQLNLDEDADPQARIKYNFHKKEDTFMESFIHEKEVEYSDCWDLKQRNEYARLNTKMIFFTDVTLNNFERMIQCGTILPKNVERGGFTEEKIKQKDYTEILDFLVKSNTNTYTFSSKNKKKFESKVQITLCLIAFSLDFGCQSTLDAAGLAMNDLIDIYAEHGKEWSKLFVDSCCSILNVLRKGNVYRDPICVYFLENTNLVDLIYKFIQMVEKKDEIENILNSNQKEFFFRSVCNMVNKPRKRGKKRKHEYVETTVHLNDISQDRIDKWFKNKEKTFKLPSKNPVCSKPIDMFGKSDKYELHKIGGALVKNLSNKNVLNEMMSKIKKRKRNKFESVSVVFKRS